MAEANTIEDRLEPIFAKNEGWWGGLLPGFMFGLLNLATHTLKLLNESGNSLENTLFFA